MLRNLVILAGLLLQTSCELVLLKKGEDAYCVSRNVQDKALAWTVKLDEHIRLNKSYNVAGERNKWIPQNVEYENLNCNPMRSENCDGWANFNKWKKKNVTWTDNYGLVLDERWNDFPLHIGLNNIPEIMELPSKNLSKFLVSVSVLSKSCVRLIFFIKETKLPDPGKSGNKYVFELDCTDNNNNIINHLILKLITNGNTSDQKFKGKSKSAFLNRGESWTNIKMEYEMKGNEFASWKINEETFTNSDASKNIKFTHFAIRASSNTFYWRHHSNYRILETSDTSSPLEANIKANNEKLCISITYLGQGNLTLYSNETTSATSVILPNNQSWTTSRYIFNLNRGKGYKLSINPSFNDIGKIEKFLLGYIRVCNEEEYKISKYKEYEKNKVRACGLLSETFIRTNMSKQRDSPFVFSCEKGHFGANCDMKCSDIDGLSDCTSVIACNSTSCSCLPGYHGVNCSQECGENKYGETCTLDCGKCDKGKQCFHANGSCPGNMCAAGFSGTLCNKPCSEGTYGKNCANNCSTNCNDTLKCNSVDGNCTGGCESEKYRPPTCQQNRAKVNNITLTENGTESVEFDVKIDVDDVLHLKSYQVQLRIKQEDIQDTNFKNSTFGSWDGTEKSLKLKVENLKPKTTYYMRVFLIETDDKYNDIPVPIIFTTLCKPAAGKEDFAIKRDNNSKSIEIQLIVKNQTNKHDLCKLDDYYIFLNDVNLTNKTNHSYQVRLENLPDLFDVINVIKIQQKFNSKINFELYKIETMKPMEENTKESGKDGTIIGILLFVILVGIVVVFVLYRKHQLAKCNERRMPVLFRQSINDNNGESSPTIAALPMRPTAPPPAVPAPEVTPAANSTEPHTCRVAVSNLQTYVEQAMITGLLKTQHALFPRGQTQPWDEGRKQEHRGKNRYGNLVAYDHTRVVLQPLPKQPHSHYINANYIDGYNSPKYYIATQGPKDTTLNDFWRMIWQENVRVIVMLANLVEDGKIKCEKYWPSLGTKTQYGSITTRTITEDEFLDYTTRDFEVINAKQTRKVRHLHYTVWPDHGVPRYPHSLAKFLRLINEVATPPVVVHCSAGVGRTGTVILAHECYKMAKSENAVDFLALVSKMRSQRPNMVDNKAQYEIAHHLLIELLIIGDTSIPSEKFAPMLRKFNDRHELPRQYAILNEASAKDAGDMEDPEFAWPKERSRFPFLVPGNEDRVLLDHQEGGSDFIN